jgi:hypothetical protein
VANRHYATCRAVGLQLTRLDGQHQSMLIIDLHIHDMHVWIIDDGVGLGA